MERGNDAPETSADAQDSNSRRPGIGDRLRETVRATGEGITGTADTITGVQFRRQFEDFTDAVTTTVVGVHRDQEKLQERTDKLESETIEVQRTQGELRERVDRLESTEKSLDTAPLVANLQGRLEMLETSKTSGKTGTSPLVIVFGVVATLALALGIIAVLRTF